MAALEPGSWVWISNEVDRYLPAQVLVGFRRGEATTVRTEDGEDHRLSAADSKDIQDCNPEALNSKIDDLINISDLNEMSILHNLRIRYKEDLIYTNISTILISVNPFKLLPLYTPAVLDNYREGTRGKPPHIFAVAHDAYHMMLSDSVDQSVVISGESGAGKSEATKLILQFLADVSGRVSHHNPNAQTGATTNLEQQLLKANPILEAFGNAKTLRNNNSSRFGKLITVNFDKNGAIIGGGVINYLLEKSRVVFQQRGERNFHIFYQLIAGGDANATLQSRLKLQDADLFEYTNQSGVINIDGVSDDKDFEEIQDSFRILNFSPDEQTAVYETVAGVLHFGNVKFKPEKRANEEDAAVVSNRETLAHAADMWGLDVDTMIKCLTTRNIGAREIIIVNYNVASAVHARDAMCKRVYAELFQIVVNRINVTLAASRQPRHRFIGVLDIFGFESFETNSFEQLCINYCNEKLQFHFNEHIFRLEQNLYESEGIKILATVFKDNQPALDLMEGKQTGIFTICDDEISVPKGSDEGFLQKVLQKHGQHPNLIRPKPNSCREALKCFGVLHYAGPVFYNVSSFLEKDKDQLHPEIVAALKTSNQMMLTNMFTDIEPDPRASNRRGSISGGAPKTLAYQFKTQLADLMATLNSTFPHFVRCMKPNDSKAGNMFVASRMQDQLRYAGLVEVCRIRKLGYSVRRDFEGFYRRYRCIVLHCANLDDLLAGMTEKKVLVPGEWAKGKTKVFMRVKQSQDLELVREKSLLSVARLIQRVARGFLMRIKYRGYKRLVKNLKDAVAARELKALTLAIDMIFELPYGGHHLPLVQEAKLLQVRLKEEGRVHTLLENAVAAREINALKSAIATALGLKPAYEPPLLAEAQAMIQKLERELVTRNKLIAAISARDRKALDELLTYAASIDLDCHETREAQALKARLDEEVQAIENLQAAMASRTLGTLTASIDKCSQMGIENSIVTAARELQGKLHVEQKAIDGLVAAIQKRNIDIIDDALTRAKSLGLSDTIVEVVNAQRLKELLIFEKETIATLEKATKSRDLRQLEEAIALAKSHEIPPESDAFASAFAMKEVIENEKRVLSNLESAMQYNDPDKLSEALAVATRLGLTGFVVDEARQKAKALGAQNEARDHLSSLMLTDSIEDLDAALAEATKLNILHYPEATALVARRKILLEVTAIVRELTRLTNEGTSAQVHDLTRLIATAERSGLSPKYDNVIDAANRKLKYLEAETKLTLQIQSAIQAGDLDELNIAISAANARGMDTSSYANKRAELETKRRIVEEFVPALLTKDPVILAQLLAKADLYNVQEDRVTQARMYMDRVNLIDKLYHTFKEAATTMNLQQLNDALKTAIELGLDSPEVAEAHVTRGKLEVVQGARNQLVAAEQAIAVKAESGLVAEDLEPLTAAISFAESIGMPSTFEPYVQAQSVYQMYLKHIEIKDQLYEAAGSGDRTRLRAALNAAEDLDMRLDIIAKVRRLLKEKDAQAEMLESGVTQQGYEATEKARQVRRDLIRHPRFELKNFPGLRSPDDFAKGVILNKQKVKDNFLLWQGSVITKSLTEMTKEFSKMAVQIHKDLLGYMGDKHMPFPAMLAQDVLRKGFESPVIRDEIFLQIIKQLTNNPRPESIAKGWQMMCMCVSTFPPSKRFENFLLHYILEKKEKGRGAVVDYSKYCFRTLEGMLASGESSGFVPSVEEILAYKERPPILATIELVDGQVITEDLPVTPDLNVGKVLEICSGWLDLRDPRAFTMGLFVYDMGETGEALPPAQEAAAQQFGDLVRTPRPLRNEDCMGDVIVQKARQRRNFKFVLKKKLFLPQHSYIGNDPYYERLVYLQCEDEVIVQGNIPILNENLGLRLACISMAVAYGDTMPNTVSGLVEEHVIDFIPPSLRELHTPEDWASRMLSQRLNCILADPEDLQKEFVTNIQKDTLYGMHWFYVYKGNSQPALVSGLPRELLIGYNCDGMHIFDLDRSRLKFFAYADIYRWGGSSTQFSLIIWDPQVKESFELVLITAQAGDMAAIILDHIRAIMSLKDGNAK